MSDKIQLGLKENLPQFIILVIVNAFVGGMIGLERTIFPRFADIEFGVTSNTALLSFIVAFGITKAITNYFAGRLANTLGRKNLLILGWIIALPIPIILIYAPSWAWVVFANILLGINQGLTWSSTVVMKIDLVGEKNRGFAMGLNEFSGYLAVGVIAYLTGSIADKFGVTPYPFYLGAVIAVIGLLLSIFFVKDTRHFVKKETGISKIQKLDHIFIDTSFRNKKLSAISQAGLVNNLNDGMIWGLLPILLLAIPFSIKEIGFIAAVYPTVWGIGQLFTGQMSDKYSKKKMLFWGMLLQGVAIFFIAYFTNLVPLSIIAGLLGFGTALVYPTFLAAIADATHPEQRAESIGVFRLWRDLGYAVGALVSGILADLFGIEWAIIAIGMVTICSALVIQIRMPEQSLKTQI